MLACGAWQFALARHANGAPFASTSLWHEYTPRALGSRGTHRKPGPQRCPDNSVSTCAVRNSRGRGRKGAMAPWCHGEPDGSTHATGVSRLGGAPCELNSWPLPLAHSRPPLALRNCVFVVRPFFACPIACGLRPGQDCAARTMYPSPRQGPTPMTAHHVGGPPLIHWAWCAEDREGVTGACLASPH